MRYRWIAAVVSVASVLLPAGIVRVRYGGTLRIETSEAEEIGGTRFAGQIYEALVRGDNRGEMKPWLATSWVHDATAREWIFSPRKNVSLADGSLWSPDENTFKISDTKPSDEILIEAGMVDRSVVESGPFRVANQRSSEFVRLIANENYWDGRPFLDSIEILMGRPRRDQLLDFELKKADVVEADVTDIKTLKQPNTAVQISKPLETVALIFDNAKTSRAVREAAALSIDRSAMHRVMLDRQGEVSGALLPQWISGYAFLFPTMRDLQRAKDLAPPGTALSLCSDGRDKLLRSLADRIALDISQAGIVVRQGTKACEARLIRLPIRSVNPQQALLYLASELNVAAPRWGSSYTMECELLRDFQVVPLFQLPLVYVLRPNVKNWSAQWDLADVWLEESP